MSSSATKRIGAWRASDATLVALVLLTLADSEEYSKSEDGGDGMGGDRSDRDEEDEDVEILGRWMICAEGMNGSWLRESGADPEGGGMRA